ncbi:hypothetical protein E1J53_0012920 [Lewinella sp. W8]|nr:hypothetical protein [Lewinella sp. W8]
MTSSLPVVVIDTAGHTVATRFPPPPGFVRAPLPADGYGSFLRNQPLLPDGTPVRLFNGQLKGRQDVHAAVLKLDVGNRDLQQCADAIMRLRAEYLWQEERFADIHFNFVSGFRADYARWRRGQRISVSGNQVNWTAPSGPKTSYEEFRRYLTMVFSYAGTASLAREMKAVPVEDIRVGDVFIRGGSPGHAVVVMDRVQNPETGAVRVLLAQSYMPAQQVHVLKNPNGENGSPWYDPSQSPLVTPEWTFTRDELKRFAEE